MKVLVIPDVHLKPYIFTRAKVLMQEKSADNAVCLMDIPDDWNKGFLIEEYVKAYDAAIDFAKAYPEALWCYGNHDLSYLWERQETGYSPSAKYTVRQKLWELHRTIPDYASIGYVQVIDRVLFCHGGVSQYFVDKYIPEERQDDIDYVVEQINSMGQEEMWHDDSPIWYRPQRYRGALYKEDTLLQVVGHTPVEKIAKDRSVISCDVFSIYQDGTPIGTQEYLVIDTVTGEFETVK